jgi:hypothetical protein
MQLLFEFAHYCFAAEDEYGILDMTPAERGERLRQIFDRLLEIDADGAVAKASTILAGLGFDKDMQQQPTRVKHSAVLSY